MSHLRVREGFPLRCLQGQSPVAAVTEPWALLAFVPDVRLTRLSSRLVPAPLCPLDVQVGVSPGARAWTAPAAVVGDVEEVWTSCSWESLVPSTLAHSGECPFHPLVDRLTYKPSSPRGGGGGALDASALAVDDLYQGLVMHTPGAVLKGRIILCCDGVALLQNPRGIRLILHLALARGSLLHLFPLRTPPYHPGSLDPTA